jgi:molybdopterin molybdotransferase
MTFAEARRSVVEAVSAAFTPPPIEEVPLDAAQGRVLAEAVAADRDYPATDRSVRDGFAVRSADVPGRLRVTGQVRAGEAFAGAVAQGEAVEIMTGAPVPEGSDAVVMVEHVTREGGFINAPAAKAGQFINSRGVEARSGARVLEPGVRIGYAEISLLAAFGRTVGQVFGKPRVAVLPTGDEVVDISARPLEYQVRNSNAWSLAAQVRRAGGVPELLPVAPDELERTRELIERGLGADLLLISGGVSAGKYDLVERALAESGAEFFFDRVLIQPGQPLVFGRVREKFFFGLPGNPASTMVTFEVIARAAVELLGGMREAALPLPAARLSAPFRHKPGLTRFLPAELSVDGSSVTPVAWHGSSDTAALARANAFLVADAGREAWNEGDWIPVLLR